MEGGVFERLSGHNLSHIRLFPNGRHECVAMDNSTRHSVERRSKVR